MASSGQITLNGITDAELIIILQAKERDPALSFNPQGMQPQQVNRGAAGMVTASYNNVQLSWQNPTTLKTILEVLQQFAAGK